MHRFKSNLFGIAMFEKVEEALSWVKSKVSTDRSIKSSADTGKNWQLNSQNASGSSDTDSINKSNSVLTDKTKAAPALSPEEIAANKAAVAAGRGEMIIPDGMNLVDSDYELKMAAFEVDCNDGFGFGTACHHVAEFYSVVKDEHDRAKNVFEKNCHRDKNPYFPSCFNLGKLYLAGRGNVKQDDVKALASFKRACDNGHLQACYHSGVVQYLLNDGTGESKTKNEEAQNDGIRILEKACVESELDSCYFAGTHYINKKTSDRFRNPVRAAELLKVACDRNHAPSCFNLAVLYKHGDTGVNADAEKYEAYRLKTQALVGETGTLKGTKAA